MNVMFTPSAWEDYQFWQERDRKVARKLDKLIKEMRRTPYDGLGKPEPLRNNLSGCWSRRLSQEHRVVYRILDGTLEIIQCRGHY